MSPLRILVSGAGIAGHVLAFWLARQGHNVTIIERFASLRVTGLQIDLRSHGIEVLKRMGLEQAFRDKAVPEQGLMIVDQKGRKKAYFPANKSGDGPQGFTSEFEIMRGDLCRMLHESIKDRVKYVFGNSIESFEEDEDSVTVRLADGSTQQFDLLVGADGVGSRTRKMMLGPETPDGFQPLKDTYVAYFNAPRPMQKDEKHIATWTVAPGGLMMLTRRNRPDQIQVYLGGKTSSQRMKDARPGDVEEEKAAMIEAFEQRGRENDAGIKLLKDSTDFYCERIGLVKLDRWSRGRVVLVGDAGYCPSVNSGMGTTCAFVGAYILAGEIGRHCRDACTKETEPENIPRNALLAAFAAYEDRFSPFMKQIQAGASDSSSWDRFSTPFAIGVLNCLLGLASLLRINVFNLGRKEDVKGWSLPNYETFPYSGSSE